MMELLFICGILTQDQNQDVRAKNQDLDFRHETFFQ